MRLPLRGTAALLASLPEPARGLGLSVTISWRAENRCADLVCVIRRGRALGG